ncbi:MAG: hypothetical protein U0841_05950 [Chloroflexia bacterium]
MRQEGFARGEPARFAMHQRANNRGGDQGRVAQRREIDEGRSFAQRGGEVGSDLEDRRVLPTPPGPVG